MSHFARMLRAAVSVLTVSFLPAWGSQEEPRPAPQPTIRPALEQPSYDLVREVGTGEGCDEAWVAANPRRGIRTRFTARGITVGPEEADGAGWSFGLSLASYGRGGELRPVRAGELAVDGNRAECRRGELVEWYVNDERGLEQGFTLLEPPCLPDAGGAADSLLLRLDVLGLRPSSASASAVVLQDEDGRTRASYAGLTAFDAEGRRLEARMSVRGEHIEIEVEDRGAVYPLVVDPMILGEDFKLGPSDGEPGGGFARSVSHDDGTLLMGAPRTTGAAIVSGAAYVFTREGDGWVEQAKLIAADGTIGADFGFSVSLDGDRALVGAYDAQVAGSGVGAAYVFTRSGSTWTQEAKLTTPAVGPDDYFGIAVALDGDRAVVGAYVYDGSDFDTGTAFVFIRNGTTWSLEQQISAPDSEAYDIFGFSVAIDGDTIVIGAEGDGDLAWNAGAAYVFVRQGGTWVFQQKIYASPAEGNSSFGRSVSLSGDRCVVGAYVYNGIPFVSGAGAAFVFRRAGDVWSQEALLQASDRTELQYFGSSVSIWGPHVVVGAIGDDHLAEDSGAAYFFRNCGGWWPEIAKLVATDGGQYHALGTRVSAGPASLIAGAPGAESQAGFGTGAAYLYELPALAFERYCFGDDSGTPCPCGNESPSGSEMGCANSTGTGADLVSAGSGSVAADDLWIHACGLVPGQVAMLFAGVNELNGGDGLPFGDGLRCTGGAVVRLGLRVAAPEGSATWGPGLSALGGWSPGESRRFQVWYRDPTGSPCGASFNTSPGLRATFVP